MNTAAYTGVTESQAFKLPISLQVCMCQRAFVRKLLADRHEEVEVWKFLEILLHYTKTICQQSREILQIQGLILQNYSQNFGKVLLKKTQLITDLRNIMFLKFWFKKRQALSMCLIAFLSNCKWK